MTAKHIYAKAHGLRTPNEGINQRYLKNWAVVADKICFGRAEKIWDWEWIFGRAVKAISSPGVRSPCKGSCAAAELILTFYSFSS